MRPYHFTNRFIAGLVLVVSLFAACAKIGTPDGGPKDEEPPRVTKTKPANYSTNLHPRKVEISFNEFVLLKNERTEFVVSPYIDELIIPRVVGKAIAFDLRTIEFDSNQTYTFGFGNSIFDNNENNPLANYQYVFSTTDYIDSMSVRGRILDAFNLLPDKEGLFVILYKNTHDSVPLTTKPYYLARTDAEGRFMLNNVATGTYKVFALKDANNNLIYDLPDEQIAFLDSLVELKPYQDYVPVRPELDTAWLSSDSIGIDIDDTWRIDSIMATLPVTDSVRAFVNDFFIDMLSFTRILPRQNLKSYTMPDERSMMFEFDEILEDTPTIELIYPIVNDKWKLQEQTDGSNKMTIWITDTVVGKSDSIALEIKYKTLDSNEAVISMIDTLVFRKKSEEEAKERRGGGRLFGRNNTADVDTTASDTIIIPKVKLQNNITNTSAFDLDKPLIITLPTPIESVDFGRIQMTYLDDTTKRKTSFDFDPEPDKYRQVSIIKKWEEYIPYKVLIPEGTFKDIYGAINDTTVISFTTQRADHYGLIRLRLQGVFDRSLIQLMNEKEDILKEIAVNADTVVNFEYLEPGKYVIKAVIDRNQNGKWDSGDYKNKQQPEDVYYYPKDVNIRANWELEAQWMIKDY